MPFGGLLTVGLIGGGASIAGSLIGANASKKAAEQQVAAANQAKADLAPIHQQNVARMDPYASIGGPALGSLRELMGFPAATPPTGYGANGQPLGPINGQQGPMNMSDPRVQHLAKGGSLVDMNTSGSTSSLNTAVPRTASSYGSLASLGTGVGGGSMPTGGGGMVRLQAPTGEVGEFPAEQAQMFIQAGATRLS
jgi:hypothetical protein